ncbi:hypothetical protein FA95DRAFT_226699 [Auriscalpium vulgare]|uniref:Uncharacterized protein n=1 Tax=Auriscalpium vulgare TaxID=40419 RepID=A0ACB8RL76_9AGAM|nr:hypothetical protein FA95DRAFT_226699 [Auriscalpium vulgare]
MLFRRVPYPSRYAYTSKPAHHAKRLLLSLRGNPSLASYVRTIHIDIDMTSDAAESLALLGLCTDVQHLYFCAYSFTNTLEEQLRTLALSPVILTLFDSASTVSRIAAIWPSVRTLKLDAYRDYDGFPHYEDDEPLDEGISDPIPIFVPSTVRSLSVDTDGVAWKFAPPDCDRSGLRELELKLPHDDAWVDLLVVAGVLPQLRFLGIDGPIPTQAALDRLTQLHTLEFTELPYYEASLPRSLRDLAYHGRACSEIEHWSPDRTIPCMLDVLDKSPALRRFTMPCGMSHRLRAKFDEVCGNRGIEVITFDRGRRFWKLNEVGVQFVRCLRCADRSRHSGLLISTGFDVVENCVVLRPLSRGGNTSCDGLGCFLRAQSGGYQDMDVANDDLARRGCTAGARWLGLRRH